MAELPPADTKVPRPVPDIPARSVSREVRCLSREGCRNSVIQALAEKLGTEVIGLDTLREAGFVSKNQLVKILGKGELTAKVQISANAFSKSAVSKIEAAGGTATTIE